MDPSNSSGRQLGGGGGNTMMLSIECLRGSSKGDEWAGDMLQTGDIVEEIRIGTLVLQSPFRNGKSGVQKILHGFFRSKETSIRVTVRRGIDDFAELVACIVPVNDGASSSSSSSGGRKQYMLRSIDDPTYAVGFVDRTEAQCLALQASRTSRIVSAMATTPLHDGYVAYPWERRMQELLSIPNSSCFLSILLLPKAFDKTTYRYKGLEDTLTRANAWLNASQASGVPVVFMNIQTESLLTKITGETASTTVNAGSLSDFSDLANVSLYGFEDYHGVDIGVVRAVRLWYSPVGGEVSIEVEIREGDTKLGFAISRTEEGFIYISSVVEGDSDTPSTRSGLSDLYREAMTASKLLVVSRISNQKVLPWMVSTTGAIRCFDTVSLSQKLSLHRHAKIPIFLHVFSWSPAAPPSGGGNGICTTSSLRPAATIAVPPEAQSGQLPDANREIALDLEDMSRDSWDFSDGSDSVVERDVPGESSFRFHNFSLP